MVDFVAPFPHLTLPPIGEEPLVAERFPLIGRQQMFPLGRHELNWHDTHLLLYSERLNKNNIESVSLCHPLEYL